MYLIPKNIKVKREIFKCFGIIEIIIIGISLFIGYLLSLLSQNFQIKLFLFAIFPITSFILIMPIPNINSNLFSVVIKFTKYNMEQKNYKKYEEKKYEKK